MTQDETAAGEGNNFNGSETETEAMKQEGVLTWRASVSSSIIAHYLGILG
jgi:hypothetical protein